MVSALLVVFFNLAPRKARRAGFRQVDEGQSLGDGNPLLQLFTGGRDPVEHQDRSSRAAAREETQTEDDRRGLQHLLLQHVDLDASPQPAAADVIVQNQNPDQGWWLPGTPPLTSAPPSRVSDAM